MNKKLMVIFLVLLIRIIMGDTLNIRKNSVAKDNDLEQKNTLIHVLDSIKTKYGATAIELSILTPQLHSPINLYDGNMAKNSTQLINNKTVFQVGSVTKPFVMLAILKLAELKLIRLDDPIGKYLIHYPQWGGIKISQLINHTSGIYDYSDSALWWARVYLFSNWSSDELLKIAYGKSYFKPSTGWHYSNTDYVILGLIIEQVAHQTLADFLNQNFIKNNALNLQNTYYVPYEPSNKIKSKLAHGYTNFKMDMTQVNGSWMQAAGAMISNTNDLAIWYKFYIHQLYDKYALLTQFVNIKDGAPLDTFDNDGYGLAIFSTNTPYGVLFFTPGLTSGYTTLVGYLPDKGMSFSYILTVGFSHENIHKYILEQILPIISTI